MWKKTPGAQTSSLGAATRGGTSSSSSSSSSNHSKVRTKDFPLSQIFHFFFVNNTFSLVSFFPLGTFSIATIFSIYLVAFSIRSIKGIYT